MTDDPVSPARRRLGARLRDLRTTAGLSGQKLGGRLDVSQPTVSSWERGRSVPQLAELRAWAVACQAPDAIGDLEALRAETETESTAWEELRRAGMRQERYARWEAAVSTIRNYQPTVVPGLLQTAAYAARVFGYEAGTEHVAKDVGDRLQRQDILFSGKRLEFVIAEEALRRRVADRPVLVAQVGKLATLVDHPTVRIGVLPIDVPPPILIPHGFIIFGDPQVERANVLVSIRTDEWRTSRPAAVAEYVGVFDAMMRAAVTGPGLRELLSAIAADHSL